MSARPLTTRERWRVVHADSLSWLADLADASVDAVVCDPPYGIDFKSQPWDGRAIRQAARTTTSTRLSHGQAFEQWTIAWATQLARVLKPGAHLVAFGAPRMAHRVACGLEDAGLELRDTLMWLYGTGMPKSRRLAGGRATALKPAYEPIVLARRAPDTSIPDCVQRHGTGALNTDACALDHDDEQPPGGPGRWPANVLLSHAPGCRPGRCRPGCPADVVERQHPGASRFLYCPKASRRERDIGCEQLPGGHLDLFPQAKVPHDPHSRRVRNAHPTVKPLGLMRWLIRLVSPPRGVVLDPFCGSGTTGCAALLEDRRFLGVELDPDHVEVAKARIAHHATATRRATAGLRRGCERRLPYAGRPRSQAGMTTTAVSATPVAVRLDEQTVDALATRINDLLTTRIAHDKQDDDRVGEADDGPGPLLTAAQVAHRWGVDRSWVYQHSDALGVIRLGAGRRPRLRFDPDRVNAYLAQSAAATANDQSSTPRNPRDSRRSRRIRRDRGDLLPIAGRSELSSSRPRSSRPGGAATPPATAPEQRLPTR